MTRTGFRPGGFGAVDGELMVDLGLLTTDLVLLMADLVLLIGGVLLMVNPGFVCVFFFCPYILGLYVF